MLYSRINKMMNEQYPNAQGGNVILDVHEREVRKKNSYQLKIEMKIIKNKSQWISVTLNYDHSFGMVMEIILFIIISFLQCLFCPPYHNYNFSTVKKRWTLLSNNNNTINITEKCGDGRITFPFLYQMSCYSLYTHWSSFLIFHFSKCQESFLSLPFISGIVPNSFL